MAARRFPRERLNAGNQQAVRSPVRRPEDVEVAPETLRLQADFAEAGGNPQLAENLRRGAELTAFSDDELLRFYEMLRPGRSSVDELDSLAVTLDERGAERCAALVREARATYMRRGLIA